MKKQIIVSALVATLLVPMTSGVVSARERTLVTVTDPPVFESCADLVSTLETRIVRFTAFKNQLTSKYDAYLALATLHSTSADPEVAAAAKKVLADLDTLKTDLKWDQVLSQYDGMITRLNELKTKAIACVDDGKGLEEQLTELRKEWKERKVLRDPVLDFLKNTLRPDVKVLRELVK